MVSVTTLVLAMAFNTPVATLAQDAIPAEVPAESAPAQPSEPVPAPTDVPPVPTAVPTAVPVLPTAIPVEPTAVPALPTDVPAEPTAIPPTLVPTVAPTPTAQPEPTPSPTPQPAVSFTEAAKPVCTIAPNQPNSVAHGDSIDYRCTHSVSITGTDVEPSAIGANWTIRASVGGGWSVSLLPPVNDPSAESPTWTPADATKAAFTFNQKNPVGVGDQSTTLDKTATIEFRLRVHRAVCSTDAQAIRLDHSVDVTVAAAQASTVAQPSESQPLLVTPSLTAIPEPTISFSGPLTFAEVGVTAAGPDASVRSGSSTLTITGLDDACGQHVLRVGASPMVDASGTTLGGSHLTVVSVNNEIIPGGACDLVRGCDVIALTAGPDAASSQTIVLGVELRMPEQPDPGSYGTSLNASILPVSGD